MPTSEETHSTLYYNCGYSCCAVVQQLGLTVPKEEPAVEPLQPSSCACCMLLLQLLLADMNSMGEGHSDRLQLLLADMNSMGEGQTDRSTNQQCSSSEHKTFPSVSAVLCTYYPLMKEPGADCDDHPSA